MLKNSEESRTKISHEASKKKNELFPKVQDSILRTFGTSAKMGVHD
jgi:hypothetical protein